MIRTVIYLLATVLVIALLRGVIGLITKAVADLFQEDSKQTAQTPRAPSGQGMGGELVKDPVCGMYVSPAVSPQKKLAGKTHFFCSEKCRDEFAG